MITGNIIQVLVDELLISSADYSRVYFGHKGVYKLLRLLVLKNDVALLIQAEEMF